MKAVFIIGMLLLILTGCGIVAMIGGAGAKRSADAILGIGKKKKEKNPDEQ